MGCGLFGGAAACKSVEVTQLCPPDLAQAWACSGAGSRPVACSGAETQKSRRVIATAVEA
jgi:hypothetical protein